MHPRYWSVFLPYQHIEIQDLLASLRSIKICVTNFLHHFINFIGGLESDLFIRLKGGLLQYLFVYSNFHLQIVSATNNKVYKAFRTPQAYSTCHLNSTQEDDGNQLSESHHLAYSEVYLISLQHHGLAGRLIIEGAGH
jgi:hypothetical protein